MAQKLKSLVGFGLKLSVAGGILGWLFSRMDVGSVWREVLGARWVDVFLAVVLMALTLPVVGWRWQRLLRVYGVELPMPVLVATVHVGQLFALVLPGSLGEDLIRTTYIARLSGQRTSVVLASVFADRVAALLGLLFLALLAMPAHWGLLAEGGAQTRLLSVGMLTAAVFALGGMSLLAWVPVSRLRALALPVLGRLPGGTRLGEWFSTLEVLAASKGVFRSVLGGALVTQLLLCLVYYFCGRAVGVEAALLTWLGFVPIILAANVVPITFAGLGVREYLLVLFLGVVASVDKAEAMAVSLLVLGVSLFQCLLGVVSYLWFQPRLAASIKSGGAALDPASSHANAGPATLPMQAAAGEAKELPVSRD